MYLGEIKCFSEAHTKYGKLEWNVLVEPVIKIIREGVYITKEMDYWFNEEGYVEDLPMQGLGEEIFYNPDGRPKQAGDKIINEPLAKVGISLFPLFLYFHAFHEYDYVIFCIFMHFNEYEEP